MFKKKTDSFTLFKTNFTARLQKATKTRSSEKVEKSFRRLDSLARLLEGNAICAAVYYDEISRQILIANNKVHSNSHETNTYITNVHKIFSLISKEDLSIEEIIDTLSDDILLNMKQNDRHYYSSLKLTEKDLKKRLEDYLIDAFQSGDSTKKWKNYKIKDEDKKMEKIIHTTAKHLKDFLKLRDFLLYKHKYDYATRNIFEAIRNKRYQILHFEGKDVHAEMRLLSHHLREKHGKPRYIGLSKLCCAHCGLAMSSFEIKNRGIHGQAYDWPLPDFLGESKAHLKVYLGEENFKIYEKLNQKGRRQALDFVKTKESCDRKENAKHGRMMQADSSSSDVEFGLTLSDTSENEALCGYSLGDVWMIKNMLSLYDEECNRLKDSNVRICIETLLDWYKNKPDKLEALLNHNVIFLVNEIAAYREELSPSDVFDELTDLYDNEYDLFNAILNDEIDENHILIKHGFDALLAEYNKSSEEYGNSNDFEEIDRYARAKNNLYDESDYANWGYRQNSEDSQNYTYGSHSSNQSDNEAFTRPYAFFHPSEEIFNDSEGTSCDNDSPVKHIQDGSDNDSLIEYIQNGFRKFII